MKKKNTRSSSPTFEDVRAIALSMPGVEETTAYGMPTEHFANYPAVLVRLDNMTKSELRELLGTAWRNAMERQRSTKKLRAKR